MMKAGDEVVHEEDSGQRSGDHAHGLMVEKTQSNPNMGGSTLSPYMNTPRNSGASAEL
jgi:hypothetical protein